MVMLLQLQLLWAIHRELAESKPAGDNQCAPQEGREQSGASGDADGADGVARRARGEGAVAAAAPATMASEAATDLDKGRTALLAGAAVVRGSASSTRATRGSLPEQISEDIRTDGNLLTPATYDNRTAAEGVVLQCGKVVFMPRSDLNGTVAIEDSGATQLTIGAKTAAALGLRVERGSRPLTVASGDSVWPGSASANHNGEPLCIVRAQGTSHETRTPVVASVIGNSNLVLLGGEESQKYNAQVDYYDSCVNYRPDGKGSKWSHKLPVTVSVAAAAVALAQKSAAYVCDQAGQSAPGQYELLPPRAKPYDTSFLVEDAIVATRGEASHPGPLVDTDHRSGVRSGYGVDAGTVARNRFIDFCAVTFVGGASGSRARPEAGAINGAERTPLHGWPRVSAAERYRQAVAVATEKCEWATRACGAVAMLLLLAVITLRLGGQCVAALLLAALAAWGAICLARYTSDASALQRSLPPVSRSMLRPQMRELRACAGRAWRRTGLHGRDLQAAVRRGGKGADGRCAYAARTAQCAIGAVHGLAAVASVMLAASAAVCAYSMLPAGAVAAATTAADHAAAAWPPVTPPLSACYAGAGPSQVPDSISSTMPLGWSEIPYNSRYEITEQGWVMGNHSQATAEQVQAVHEKVMEYQDVFAYKLDDLKGCTHPEGSFAPEMEGAVEGRSRRQRHSQLEQEVQDEKCRELEDAGFIRRATKEDGVTFVHAVVIAAKKDEQGNWTDKRHCTDMRPSNKKAKKDVYQMPTPDSLFQEMGGSVYFSTFDMRSGFHNIVIPVAAQSLFAFYWRGETWLYTRMPFGHVNAPATYQRVMDALVREADVGDKCVVYMDDVVIHTTTVEEHIAVIDALFAVFRRHQMFVHPKKTLLMAEDIEFLGHRIHPGGVSPHQAKVAGLLQLRDPTSPAEVRSLLGSLQYYSAYVPSFSDLAAPVTKLLRKGQPFEWGDEQRLAKARLLNEMAKPGKVLRPFDPSKPTHVWTDWSSSGIGALLTQPGDDGKEKLVATSSRTLNKHERNYAPTRGEQLAMVHAVRVFRPYLHGRRFVLFTDHEALVSFNKTCDITQMAAQAARWALILQEFDFEIRYVRGAEQLADVPSRFTTAGHEDRSGAQLDREQPKRLTALMATEANRGTAAYASSTWAAEHRHWFAQRTSPATAFFVTLDDFEQGHAIATVVADVDDTANYARQLAARAARWVHPISPWHPATPVGYPGDAFFQTDAESRLVVVELCGGVCAGLEGVLRNGAHVAAYYYCDCDESARAIARRRTQRLAERYADQLAPDAFAGAWDLPNDANDITIDHFKARGLHLAERVVLMAGWPCQDLSSAPTTASAGLRGGRSSLLNKIHGLINSLQQERASSGVRPAAYILENVAMQYNSGVNAAMGQESFDTIRAMLGEPITFDAAAVGSRAHRLRNWWTNLASAPVTNAVLQAVKRPAGILVDQVLEKGWHAPATSEPSRRPFYPCNGPHTPREALPTLTASLNSWAYRGEQGAGMLVRADRAAREPNPDEREQLLGFEPGASAAEGVSTTERHRAMGNCWDVNAAAALWSVAACLARQRWQPPQESAAHAVIKPPPIWAIQPGATLLYDELEESYPKGVDMLLKQHSPDEVKAYLQTEAPLQVIRMEPGGLGTGTRGDAGGAGRRPLSAELHDGSAERGAGSKSDATGGVPPSHPSWPRMAAGGEPQGGDEAVDPELMQPCRTTLTPTGVERCTHDRAMYDAALAAAARLAELDPATPAGERRRVTDVWTDPDLLNVITKGQTPPGAAKSKTDALRRRARNYSQTEGGLRRLMPDGNFREVPKPDSRVKVIEQAHARAGHAGMTRTEALVRRTCWWPNLSSDVRKVLAQCQVCDRVHASKGGNEQPQLRPLPIRGMGYRWSSDWASGFPTSRRGNKHMLVHMCHTSKQVEVSFSPTKTALDSARLTKQDVYARYGSPAEHLTDGGPEFDAEFDDQCKAALVEHRHITPGNPKANGLAERMVGTLKTVAAKIGAEASADEADWEDRILDFVAAYRVTKQASTKFSPFELMYGREPALPGQLKERFADAVDFDGSPAHIAALVDEMSERAALLQRTMPLCMANLEVAQHRDKLRYARTRDRTYLPTLRRYAPGDLVYLTRTEKQATQPGTYGDILQVMGFKDSGNLVLEGKDATQITVGVDRVAPCHLTNIDLRRNPMLATAHEEQDVKCQRCRSAKDEESMLLCDACGHGYHLWCLRPPLAAVPQEQHWVCPECEANGRQPRDWRQDGAIDVATWTTPARAAEKRADAACRELHGAEVNQDFMDPDSGHLRPYKGRAEYYGWGVRPPFRVTFEDGEVHQMTTAQLKKIVVSRHQRSATAAAAVAAAHVPTAESLPDAFELNSKEGVNQALEYLMPGVWPASSVTRLLSRTPGGSRFLQQEGDPRPGQPECVGTEEAEVEALHQAVDLTQCGGEFFDPFVGTGGIARALRKLDLVAWANDINKAHKADWHEDALQPALYRRVMGKRPIAAIITSPWYAVLDLAVPLIAAFTWKVSFVHVPMHYVFDAHSRRARFLAELQRAGRLALVGGLPRGPVHRRCMWLCIFASSAVRTQLLGTAPPTGGEITWAPLHMMVDARSA